VAPGSRDDAVRHAITKLAHLHFPATADAARRLRRMGEPAWRIKLAGAPAIDAMRQLSPVNKESLDGLVGFDTGKPFALVVQHAAGFDARQERDFLLGTLRAVEKHFDHAVVIGPGLDAGSSLLHTTIRDFVAKKTSANGNSWAFVLTLDQPDYFALLSRAAVLVGNSSSGIIEAASFRCPVVNVGPRQRGRLCSGNVIHCEYGKPAVSRAISRAMNDRGFRTRLARCRSVYGGGQAGEIVARTLVGTKIDRRLLVKETG
jgi:UDP-hydrolysing UDP-N-acetyl-D-glucosamine 2-epimerase